MLIGPPLTFITEYINSINDCLAKHNPNAQGLSKTQKYWLSFCVAAILVTNTVCWAKFSRANLGGYSLAGLSWMFRHSKVPWEQLLVISTRTILHRHGIKKGVLALDETDKKRSKSTKNIAYLHKRKDKASGGFMMGQCLVFLVLITDKITIPVGFAFYQPDPEVTKWHKKEKQRKKEGKVCKAQPKPKKDERYPTILDIALQLLEQFKEDHSDINVQCVLADALYGTQKFLDTASDMFGGIQVISQIRRNQNIGYHNEKRAVSSYFETCNPGVTQNIRIRGAKETVTAIISSARLYVCRHGKKRFIIALKYEGESEYRYLMATDLTWRTIDIVNAYTLRWLIEVFFQDWKSNEGWGELTKQTGKEGSSQSLILSLLADHCLFVHPDQQIQLDNNLPAHTVGSLRNQIKVESLMAFIYDNLALQNPQEQLGKLSQMLKDGGFVLNPSEKHMAGRDLGRLEPTPSLKYRAA